jgi:hypothetical protein
LKLQSSLIAPKASTLDAHAKRSIPSDSVHQSAARLSAFGIAWYLVNASLLLALVLTVYSIGWEYSTRRYLTGFSDAIVPATAPADEKIEAILNWMKHGPARRDASPDELLADRDPTDTLNYDALLKVCGTATNAFINLIDSGGLESRRLLLLNSEELTNHVVAEVLVDGRWIVVDPAYRIILRGADGKPLTREKLTDPVTFGTATGSIPGYNAAYTYQNTEHVRLARLPLIGRPLRTILAHVLPRWQDSAMMTLFVERSSFGAMIASTLLVLFLVLLRVAVRWFGERRLGIHVRRIRSQLRQASGAFLRTAGDPEIPR